MKRQRLILFSMILIYCVSHFTSQSFASSNTGNTPWPEGPSVFAESAIVMEASTGLILYEKNIHTKHYPASITKIMTSLLAVENSTPGEIVTFSHDSVYKVEADSSRLWIEVGEQLTMQQSLYSILLESANDVAYATAEHIGGGSLDNFIQMMNNRAKEIGATNTNFMNPHGLHDDNHYTTSYDMALITREAMKNDSFRKIFAARTSQIPPTNKQTETRYLRNHHRFILKQDYFYSDCIGGKTGYTSKSKFTLVTVAKRGDLELITVIMRDDTSQHQYTDTQKLLDFCFDNFSIYPLANLEGTQNLESSPFFTRYNGMLSDSNAIVTDENGYVVLPNNASIEEASKEVSFFTDRNELEDNNIIGAITYTYQDKYVGGADILYNAPENITLYHKDFAPEVTEAPSTVENPTLIEPSRPLRPIIIGIIIGIFVLVIGLYFVIVERPRLRRRKAFYRKRANRKLYQDDHYLDL